MDPQFYDCVSKVISRLYRGPPEVERQLREWIMSDQIVPAPSLQSWIKNKVSWETTETNFEIYKDAFYMSIAALQKEICSRTIGLPGYGYPVEWVPNFRRCFPTIMGKEGVERPSPALLLREICMLKVIEDITNNPGWYYTVRYDQFAEMFKAKMLALKWTKDLKYADFTHSMADLCISELRRKADLYELTGLIPVLDYSACVLKSDRLVSAKLKRELIASTNKLEGSCSNTRHCGNSVLHLIDPSLYPLVYGRSRILPDRTISLANCLEACGNGNTDSASKRIELEEWFSNTHPIGFSEPKSRITKFRLRASDAHRDSVFRNGNKLLQVIVQLTSINLTPENPDYRGGEWQLDGQLNEHIMSTARFYYDSDNITSSCLYFRSVVDKDDINSVPGPVSEDDFTTMERVFGVSPRTSMFQDIGRVHIQPGGTIFYSNLYQHGDGPFSLADRSRPGYRKVLILYLVDPAITVISTANVPPQQKHWWTESNVHHEGLKIAEMLPPELRRMVHSYVDMPIDHDEAEKIREELLKDRAQLKEELNEELFGWRWDYLFS